LQRSIMMSSTTTAFSGWASMTTRPMIWSNNRSRCIRFGLCDDNLKCCVPCLPRVSRERVVMVRKVKIAEPCVLTIGHSNRSWKDFLDLLRGAPRQARHRHTQYPLIEAQPSVRPGHAIDQAVSREDRLHAFAKARGFAPCTTRFAEHGLAQWLIWRLLLINICRPRNSKQS
jgi:hypothetical protein